jgi:hypothetical protein
MYNTISIFHSINYSTQIAIVQFLSTTKKPSKYYPSQPERLSTILKKYYPKLVSKRQTKIKS